MSSLNKSPFLRIFLSYLPVLLLFFSVFNEFDFNYLKLDYFAFNFVHLLIFFWTLRNPDQLGYLAIFFAGIINDVVIGIPIGISSFCYLILCSVTAYKKHNFNPKLYEGLDIIIIYNFINKLNSSNYFGFSLFN